MNYVSINFYIFVVLCVILYYVFPMKYRWITILIGNIFFYLTVSSETFIFFLVTGVFSWGLGCLLYVVNKKSVYKEIVTKIVLGGAIVSITIPLFVVKYSSFVINMFTGNIWKEFIMPIGISFYTLQMISYLVDIYREKHEPEYNFLKYMLYISFFPQIIQGPISRYEQMKQQLYHGNQFEERKFVKGIQLIIWGFFLKFMIADKASIIVDTIFNDYDVYVGWYVVLAGALYSIQLYTDFLACVTISQGVAALFGIEIMDNFNHPYMATSIKDFWRRWHISLSSWLRDYIYIPLGGNRKGKICKYINLMLTFGVSGVWHGVGYKYIFWGMLHGIYQIIEDITAPIINRVYHRLKIGKDCHIRKWLARFITLISVMIAWIIFRADSLRIGLHMLKNMLALSNTTILFDGSILNLGLSYKQMLVLLCSIGILIVVSVLQEKIELREYILNMNIVCRWGIYICVILTIMIFGTYGLGYNAQDFIYGGF